LAYSVLFTPYHSPAKCFVKPTPTDDATPGTSEDQEYQARTVRQYLNDQIEAGWQPEEEREHVIYTGNPPHPEAENG